ncbi:hypothetical protein [Streptomyces lushanensis]|uniref:hypothetical protein n=1 Tax=Streptomyces lushanensis TaxID=1434255 RepID=UPI000833EFA3|nr:hypothetical protein [Streptomyces lushanensis]
MSTAAFTPPHAPHGAPPPGATVSGAAPHHPAHHVGNALRAVKVFVSTAFRVAVLGEYAEEAGITRGHRL